MRIAAKLALAFAFVFWVGLAVFGYLRIERERRLFDEDIRRDEHALGRALSRAFDEAWARGGAAAAIEAVAGWTEHQDGADVRFVSLEPAPAAAQRPAAPAEVLAGLLEKKPEVVWVGPEPDARVYTYVAVQRGAASGAIEISRSLAEERAYLRVSIRNTVLAAVTIGVFGTIALIVVGAWLIARPVHALVGKARRTGEGDLERPLELRQRDELGVLADEMNRMCERLDQARAELERETSERLRTLEALRHADRLATVGRLAAGIAHELGTPLNVVAGRAKMIVRGCADGGEAADNARIVVEQSERMTRIIRQLLDFARRRPIQRAPTDLGELASGTAKMLEPLARKRGIALRVDAARTVEIEGDVGQLQQALTNLVMNAIQAASPGTEVLVRVEGAEAAPGSTASPVRYGRVAVSDRGPGIDQAAVAHIFEPFFTTKPIGEGTGLGLSVTHGIVQEHGGFITVDTTPGVGSTFTLHLPLPARVSAAFERQLLDEVV